MNLNRLIPSKPSQLGKYPDQAVLTAPVTISVGVPTEKRQFLAELWFLCSCHCMVSDLYLYGRLGVFDRLYGYDN